MNPELSILHQVVRNGIAKGVGHLPVEAVDSATPVMSMKGAELLNFSSCSYLGLEHHDALIEGTVQAPTVRNPIQFIPCVQSLGFV